jgi:hypothetical protein
MEGSTPLKTPTSAEEKAAPPPGADIAQSMKTGNPLPLPSASVIEGHAHGHSPRIPWPADKPVDHKPFKTKE